jgi:cyclophilin family peptidyl-prolyl cis-trans isomerase
MRVFPFLTLVLADFRVRFEVDHVAVPGSASFTMVVHNDWAPLGAARFAELVEAKFYDDSRFFRVMKHAVVFGLSGDPAGNRKWHDNPIKDDPGIVANKVGMVTFTKVGEDSRKTAILIHLHDNPTFDAGLAGAPGFVPFAEIEGGPDGDGMSVVRGLFNESSVKPREDRILKEGNKYLDAEFPNLSRLRAARILDDSEN